MSESSGTSHYRHGNPMEAIAGALRAANLDPDHLTVADLAPLDEFHVLGREATVRLAELAGIKATDHVLDLGAGLGGPARVLAHRYECQVSTIDLSAQYCAAAEKLNMATGLSDRITVTHGDMLDLPFPDQTFDVVWSQHAQMNVEDKQRLYAQARRVLKKGGRLALWDITAVDDGPIEYPVPWADSAATSFLVTSQRLSELLAHAGFDPVAWNDLTEPATTLVRTFVQAGPNPLGLQVFVPDFPARSANLLINLEQGRLRLIQAVLLAV